jgi:hypothetical protein
MPSILSEMKNMARRTRMEATSGCVMILLARGEMCSERVREMPKKVVRRWRRGFAKEGGRRRGRRAA